MASGAKSDRIGWAALMTVLCAGNTIVIWRLDRLGRSLKNLIKLVERLEAAKIGLRSLQENSDTTSSSGRLVFHLFGTLVEFERNLVRERSRLDGWTKRLDLTKLVLAFRLHHEDKHIIKKICQMMGIPKSTLD